MLDKENNPMPEGSVMEEDFDWDELEMFEGRHSRVEARMTVAIVGSGKDTSCLQTVFKIIKKVDGSLESAETARASAGIP